MIPDTNTSHFLKLLQQEQLVSAKYLKLYMELVEECQTLARDMANYSSGDDILLRQYCMDMLCDSTARLNAIIARSQAKQLEQQEQHNDS